MAKNGKSPKSLHGKGEVKKVPFYCYQCVAGPDLAKVTVRDGVAERLEANFDIKEEHPGGGRICVKAFGLIQKTYNPNRVQQPMKRTNPKKGRDEDPGICADLVGRGLRHHRQEIPRSPRQGSGQRKRPSAPGVIDRRRWHTGAVYGHLPGLHGGLGADRPGLRRRAGRQVLPLRASLRRVVAPRLHRCARYALCELHPELWR